MVLIFKTCRHQHTHLLLVAVPALLNHFMDRYQSPYVFANRHDRYFKIHFVCPGYRCLDGNTGEKENKIEVVAMRTTALF